MMQGKITEKAEKKILSVKRGDVGVWKKRINWLFRQLIYACAGYLLGCAETAFGTYPLGLAFLCAAGTGTLSVLAGLIASALSGIPNPVVMICTYSAAAFVRVVAGFMLESPDAQVELPGSIRKKLHGEQTEQTASAGHGSGRLRALGQALRSLFSESVCLRMGTSAVCALIIALYRIISGGFRYYDLIAAGFVLLATPMAVLLYSVFLEGRVKNRILRAVSGGALLFSVVWASAGFRIEPVGFSIPVILALFFTLIICKRCGATYGISAAAVAGGAVNVLYAPAFVAGALAFLLLNGKKRENTGSFVAVLAMSGWSFYIGGADALLVYLPAGLLAGMAYMITVRLMEGLPSEQSVEECNEGTASSHPTERKHFRDSNDHLREISDALSSLSEMFYNLSDRFRRPGTLDLRNLCDVAFDAHCHACPNKTVCWGLEYTETLGAVNTLIAQLHTKGKVTRDQMPEAILNRCDAMDAIVEKINRDCARLTGEMLKNNRTEIFAMDYEAAAKIINEALEEEDGEYRFDPDLERRVTEYLTDAGIGFSGVTVFGNRRRKVLVRGVNVENAKVSAETLRADLGEMCGVVLSRPVFEVEHSDSTMYLQAKKKISVIGAQNNVSADGGVSGDALNLFSNKKDFFYALINDGMGAGKEAALTSNLCSAFLEKMLRAGNRAGTSIRMLNNMICSKDENSTRECSSTVDLLELDLMNANASFIKSGAAPSFVVRGNVVHRIQSGTAPIGIIRGVEAQTTTFSLRAGDIVVMISDGILEYDPDCEWITAYLTHAEGLTPDEIVYHICLHAAERDKHDDCSAIALQVANDLPPTADEG